MNGFLDIINQALQLNPDVWLNLLETPDDLRFRTAFGIVLLAGLSEAMAQSTMLFLNQVKPRRFLFTLGVSACIFLFGYIFYVLSIGFIANVLFGASLRTDEGSIAILFRAVALAYTPLLFNFLTLIPYFGRLLQLVLSVYHLIALVIAVKVVYGLGDGAALTCVIVGWLFLSFAQHSIGRPLITLARTLRNRSAGTQLKDVPELLPDILRESVAARGPNLTKTGPPHKHRHLRRRKAKRKGDLS